MLEKEVATMAIRQRHIHVYYLLTALANSFPF